MSTRKILKSRKNFFELIVKKEPENKTAKKVVHEIDFLLKKLKEEYIYPE